jgi:hypothetical protein
MAGAIPGPSTGKHRQGKLLKSGEKNIVLNVFLFMTLLFHLIKLPWMLDF